MVLCVDRQWPDPLGLWDNQFGKATLAEYTADEAITVRNQGTSHEHGKDQHPIGILGLTR